MDARGQEPVRKAMVLISDGERRREPRLSG
jgi:hypothetical protein